MTPSLIVDVVRGWFHREAQPEDAADRRLYEQRKAALIPILAAAIVTALMIVALIGLPGIP